MLSVKFKGVVRWYFRCIKLAGFMKFGKDEVDAIGMKGRVGM